MCVAVGVAVRSAVRAAVRVAVWRRHVYCIYAYTHFTLHICVTHRVPRACPRRVHTHYEVQTRVHRCSRRKGAYWMYGTRMSGLDVSGGGKWQIGGERGGRQWTGGRGLVQYLLGRGAEKGALCEAGVWACLSLSLHQNQARNAVDWCAGHVFLYGLPAVQADHVSCCDQAPH